jgi:hypothetical protein
MFLQGNLQSVFEALYSAGVVQGILKADWKDLEKRKRQNLFFYEELLNQVNRAPKENLESLIPQLPREFQEILAMEVANEYAEFSERTLIH